MSPMKRSDVIFLLKLSQIIWFHLFRVDIFQFSPICFRILWLPESYVESIILSPPAVPIARLQTGLYNGSTSVEQGQGLIWPDLWTMAPPLEWSRLETQRDVKGEGYREVRTGERVMQRLTELSLWSLQESPSLSEQKQLRNEVKGWSGQPWTVKGRQWNGPESRNQLLRPLAALCLFPRKWDHRLRLNISSVC